MKYLLRLAFCLILYSGAAAAADGTYEYKLLQGDGPPPAEKLNEFAEQGWHVLQIIPIAHPKAETGMQVLVYLERLNTRFDRVECKVTDENGGLGFRTYPRMPTEDEIASGESVFDCRSLLSP